MTANRPTIHKTIVNGHDAGSHWFTTRMKNLRTSTIEPGMLVSVHNTNAGSTYIGCMLDDSIISPQYRKQFGVARDRMKLNENGAVITHGVVTNLWAIGTITGGNALFHGVAAQLGIATGFAGTTGGIGIGIALETNANTDLKKIKAFIGYKV